MQVRFTTDINFVIVVHASIVISNHSGYLTRLWQPDSSVVVLQQIGHITCVYSLLLIGWVPPWIGLLDNIKQKDLTIQLITKNGPWKKRLAQLWDHPMMHPRRGSHNDKSMRQAISTFPIMRQSSFYRIVS